MGPKFKPPTIVNTEPTEEATASGRGACKKILTEKKAAVVKLTAAKVAWNKELVPSKVARLLENTNHFTFLQIVTRSWTLMWTHGLGTLVDMANPS